MKAIALFLRAAVTAGLLGLLAVMPASAHHGVSLASQYEQARSVAEKAGLHRFVLASAAMDASSTAFVGDVKLAEQVFRAQVPQAAMLHLANGMQRAGPEVTARSLRQMFVRAGSLVSGDAAPGSLVVVLLSSHGHVGYLSAARSFNDGSSVHVSELREWLAPLGDTTPTLLIISACYSGSLIPLLEQPNRIIITAASERTSSFGCEPESRNTYFIDELFSGGLDASQSIEQWFARGAQRVAEREKAMKLAPPSNPQLWVGEKVQALAGKPWRDVLAPFNASPAR